MRSEQHTLEPYKCEFVLIDAKKPIEFKNKFKELYKDFANHKEENDPLYAHCIYSLLDDLDHEIYGTKCIFIVFNTNHPTSPITPGVVAHEAFHASDFVLEKIGADSDRNNSEPQAYLIEYFTEKIHKFLGKKIKNETIQQRKKKTA